ncbi:MAG: LPS assembly lipoprotein LptE [Nitrospinota bacterium]
MSPRSWSTSCSRALAALLLILPGCGYGLVGTARSEALRGIHRISIPIFDNITREPGIETTISSAVRNQFIQDGRLQVVETEVADAILEGRVKSYSLEPISFNREDAVAQYRLRVRVEVVLRDRNRDRVVFQQDVESDRTYTVATSIALSDEARRNALDQAAAELAELLTSLVIEGF